MRRVFADNTLRFSREVEHIGSQHAAVCRMLERTGHRPPGVVFPHRDATTIQPAGIDQQHARVGQECT